jgi:Na+-translocating ferredoxin:NAD+ oxidoreductase RnfD subunit
MSFASAADRRSSDEPTPAVSARARAAWMLLALCPGAALTAWTFGAPFALRTAAAVAAMDRIVASGRRAPWNPAPLLMATIALLWLPAAVPTWSAVGAAVAAWACARLFERLPGQSPFHPAMVACALALIVAPHASLLPAGEKHLLLIAGSYFAAGLALVLGRCIRWQVPLAAWAGSAVVSLSWQAAGADRPTPDLLFASLPAFALIEFFIATDPGSGCMSPRARWLFAACIGILSRLALLEFRDPASAFLGMAGAVLLANAAAPWLDRAFPARRPTGVPNP